jgi:hypothetical protein
VPRDDLFVLGVVASMTAKGFTILSQVMIYDRSTNPGICKHASLDREKAKDTWSFQCFQGRKLFVYEDQSPVKEDVADVQAKILKGSLLRGWNTTHESVAIGSTYELNVYLLKKTGKASTLH